MLFLHRRIPFPGSASTFSGGANIGFVLRENAVKRWACTETENATLSQPYDSPVTNPVHSLQPTFLPLLPLAWERSP